MTTAPRAARRRRTRRVVVRPPALSLAARVLAQRLEHVASEVEALGHESVLNAIARLVAEDELRGLVSAVPRGLADRLFTLAGRAVFDGALAPDARLDAGELALAGRAPQ